ncbi:enoyl-CoA hydratase [Nocardioides gansuensis]|uniref:Enoyl-CoA hydratase n=1 Tax=Nocardioides gansuensis TaxID=2138300 RepID=A0A2T8F4I7_9ACTN|nr:crotonase/enoyl-CoA hydratase family protein [Nocardioides gansuensis]PVG80621.1 enoyl-CoA hydratase [Nocardioides gansuensis]
MSEALVVTQHDDVLVIAINRPEARNALDAVVAHGVAEAVDELDSSDELRVGVLTGAGGTFSSGMDLKAFVRGETPLIEGRGLCGITVTPPRKPLIAAVEGFALAGGLELVLACDIVVAARSAMFGVPEVKRALIAGGGGALLLPKRIPAAFALEMLLTGDPVTAEKAAAFGLVNRVVEDGAALDEALVLARTIALNGSLAVAVTKQIARATVDWSWQQGWTEQEQLILPVITSQDATEGATAFAEKRPPRWTGR